MGLKQLIARTTSSVFLNDNGFAERIRFWKGGDPAYPASREFTANAVVMPDPGEGDDERVDGDGRRLNRGNQKRIRRSMLMEYSSTLDLDDTRDPPDRCFWEGDVENLGGWYIHKRIMERDTDMVQSLWVHVAEPTRTRARKRG